MLVTYRAEFWTDDVKKQRENIESQAELADPRSDASWDVGQHGGQSVPAAEETRGGLQRNRGLQCFCEKHPNQPPASVFTKLLRFTRMAVTSWWL